MIFLLTLLLFSLFPLPTVACNGTFENTTVDELKNPVFQVNVSTNEKTVRFLPTKEKAYRLLQEKDIWTRGDFLRRRPSDPELQQIPRSPEKYKPYKGWRWRHVRFLAKEEAYKLLRKKKITLHEEFLWRRPTERELQQIYSHPYIYYEGWSWPEARGEEKIEFLSTKEEAYDLIREKKILSRRDFSRRRAFDKELQQIPRSPEKYKPYKGWSWLDAYGEKN